MNVAVIQRTAGACYVSLMSWYVDMVHSLLPGQADTGVARLIRRG